MRLSYFELPPKTRKAIDDVLSVKSPDSWKFNGNGNEDRDKYIPFNTIGNFNESSGSGNQYTSQILNIKRNVDRWVEALDFIGVKMTNEIRDELMPYLLCGNETG